MKKMLKIAAAGALLSFCSSAYAAALIGVTIVGTAGPGSGATWNTAADATNAVFVARPATTIQNPTDVFAPQATTIGANNYNIFGDGLPAGSSANSDTTYTITLNFNDGAVVSGTYVGSTFTPTAGSVAVVGGTTYTLTGFGWDRTNVDTVTRFSALTNGDDPADYTGQFAFNQTALPEPATWAMMLIGFGMIGFAARRRGRQTVRVAYA